MHQSHPSLAEHHARRAHALLDQFRIGGQLDPHAGGLDPADQIALANAHALASLAFTQLAPPPRRWRGNNLDERVRAAVSATLAERDRARGIEPAS